GRRPTVHPTGTPARPTPPYGKRNAGTRATPPTTREPETHVLRSPRGRKAAGGRCAPASWPAPTTRRRGVPHPGAGPAVADQDSQAPRRGARPAPQYRLVLRRPDEPGPAARDLPMCPAPYSPNSRPGQRRYGRRLGP